MLQVSISCLSKQNNKISHDHYYECGGNKSLLKAQAKTYRRRKQGCLSDVCCKPSTPSIPSTGTRGWTSASNILYSAKRRNSNWEVSCISPECLCFPVLSSFRSSIHRHSCQQWMWNWSMEHEVYNIKWTFKDFVNIWHSFGYTIFNKYIFLHLWIMWLLMCSLICDDDTA